MTRDELQEHAAQRLAYSHRLLCQWATGTGKSNVVLKFLQKHPSFTCLILVPEQNNIENWEHEFTKFGVPMEYVRIICYASLHKYRDTHWNLLVCDECPHTDTELKVDILRTITATYVLALGAVVAEWELDTLNKLYGKFAISNITLSKAIEMGILPQPSVRILHMMLDNEKRRNYHNGQMLTDAAMYKVFNDKVENAKAAFAEHPTDRNRDVLNHAGNRRKRFLGKMKVHAVKKCCEELESRNKRFLCFCASIPQAKQLGKDHAFTSKTPKTAKLLEKFNNHEIDSLYVVGKLIEGQNLKDIDCGIIGQIGGQERITVQMIGRIMRSEKPIVFIPIVDDTKDEWFLGTVTCNIPESYIKHYKL